MNTADGDVSELSHFLSFEIGVFGICRKIYAFIRPTQRKNNELDLHFLTYPGFMIYIRESRITIGDPGINEQVLAIQGPTLLQSNTHKLILNPKTAESSKFPLLVHVITHESVQSSDTDFEASDDTDSSSFDDEIPKNMSATVENPDVLNGKHANKAEYIPTVAENQTDPNTSLNCLSMMSLRRTLKF
ncbi:hypothetical protein GcM1_240130 [Golovinomyces cichoracearum]|uniref:Uncharacterized protein n=1 Tax=Golovinomyces cichoracearum TaxID=62708 RepID=A0A420IIG9_9PEZI|nr:hypothetical protein GcM1_240130 [Golovinomyces cichoracearum]